MAFDVRRATPTAEVTEVPLTGLPPDKAALIAELSEQELTDYIGKLISSDLSGTSLLGQPESASGDTET